MARIFINNSHKNEDWRGRVVRQRGVFQPHECLPLNRAYPAETQVRLTEVVDLWRSAQAPSRRPISPISMHYASTTWTTSPIS